MRTALVPALALFVTAGAAFAQNEITHHDGTIESVSRGTNAANAKTLLQRVPADQVGGAAAMTGATVLVQDQNFNTAEILALELRGNDPLGPATGQPNMAAAGLIGTTGNLTLQFPTPTTGVVSGVFVTISFAAPVAAPSSSTTVVPAGDAYFGVALGPAPSWPGTDGISAGASLVATGNPGEQMNPAAVGYSGTAGAAGLGWQADTTLATPPTLGSANRAWFFASRWSNGTLQPSANNATAFTGNPTTLAGNGLNPNYGHAGLWPHMLRAGGPDNIGFRARFTTPVGTPVLLFVGTTPIATPATAFGVNGKLCIDPNAQIAFLELKNTVAPPTGQPATTSEVLFGAYPGSTSYPAGTQIYAQAVALPAAGTPSLSSMCKIEL
ncbi:MAG: hypothetical protein IPH13_19855 [Planctomycetes bacterium]|nr:hypothetical protein [Planctomycetota bacterium]MCC7171582.1 hypothetical protein [Planctomycetota bacterium]